MRPALAVIAILCAGCYPVTRQDDVVSADPRLRALAGVRPGTAIRLQTTDLGSVSGEYQGRREGKIIVQRGADVLTIDVATVQSLHHYHDASFGGLIGGALGAVLLPSVIEFMNPNRKGPLRVDANLYGPVVILGLVIGAGAGAASSGWAQAWPDPMHPASWMHSAAGAAGPLRVDVRLSDTRARRADSLVATIAISNASADTLELLERECGPMLAIVSPRRREWAAPACGPGLRVTRLPPGTLTRQLTFATSLSRGIYQIEARVVRLQPARTHHLDAAGAQRVSARAGMVVQ